MPKITHNSLINLTAFRQKNGLLQQDIANFLGVSRGYVSMVEKGASKLSRKNIDRLYEAHTTRHWDLSDLVPAFTRLQAVENYLNVDRNKQRESQGQLPAFFASDPDVEERIRYGEIGISTNLDFVQMWCEMAPEINIDWLVNGDGSMINPSVTSEGPSTVDVLVQEIRELKESVANLEIKLCHGIEELIKHIDSVSSSKNE